MLDTIDKERFSIIAQNYAKLKAPNTGTIGAGNYGGNATSNSGLNQVWNTESLSRATKIIKFWIPGSKFARNGVVHYENGSQQVKFFDYHLLVYAYSNYTTTDGIAGYNVALQIE